MWLARLWSVCVSMMKKWEHGFQIENWKRLLKKLQVSEQADYSDNSLLPTDISECVSNPCQNGGTCVEGVNQYKCTCPQNWSGSHCQHQTQTGQYLRVDVWDSLFCLYLHVSDLLLFTICSLKHRTSTFIFSPLLQHHLSGALWMIQHSAGDLAVPKWTEPNTAAVMQAFTWVAPLTTVSVRVSCNYVLL